jgi:capsid portal protein
VGKGNLSLPYISARYKGGQGYVRFGNDNLYPQLLNQMYYSSPLHSSIINFIAKATVGGGYDLGIANKTAPEKVEYYTFDKKMKLNRLVEIIAIDLIMHNRFYLHKKTMKRISPEKVRVSDCKKKYFVCEDWSTNIDIKTYRADELYIYENFSIGQDYYPLPSYSSALNWVFLDGDMSALHKANIQNSIFPSFAIMFPKKFTTEEEKQEVISTIEKAKGSSEAGKVITFSGNGKEMLPEITPIPTNQNDKLFIETDEQINLKICQAHTIDPMLMGVRVSGKLGGGSDIKQAYIIFEKNKIMPLRMEVEEIVNDLMVLSGLHSSFKLNDYQIINETIVETDEKGSKTTEALNTMSPLVATKVLETLTVNEIRSLAGLPKVKDGDKVGSQQETKVQPTFNV